MTVTFISTGSSETFGVGGAFGEGVWPVISGGPDSTNSPTVNGNPRSVRAVAGSVRYVESPAATVVDAGFRITCYMQFDTAPAATCSIINIVTSGGTIVVRARLTTGGVLQLWDSAAQRGSNGSTLSVNTWYRLCLSGTITSGSVNSIKLFVNGVVDITLSNVTITTTGADRVRFGNASGDANATYYWSDFYIDDSNAVTDTGNIRCTAKRPTSNGTLNELTTQIGSGGSGVGSGHSPQVNERPQSQSNGWSLAISGVAKTEEYTLEAASAGDVDLSSKSIVAVMGWVTAGSGSNETAQIIVDGASSNIALTSTITTFTKVGAGTTYPSTGAAIGITTATTSTTVSLYECGIVIAYVDAPPVTMPPKPTFARQAPQRAGTR